jgi:hypothetical protein
MKSHYGGPTSNGDDEYYGGDGYDQLTFPAGKRSDWLVLPDFNGDIIMLHSTTGQAILLASIEGVWFSVGNYSVWHSVAELVQ